MDDFPDGAAVAAPGYYVMDADRYHSDPAPRPSTSAGVLTKMVQDTPADAWWAHPRLNPAFEAKSSKDYDLGSVAHTLLLGVGREVVVIDADDWRTKAAQQARIDAEAAGQQPCLAKVYEKADAMVTVAREVLGDDPENRDAFTGGTPEIAAFAKLPTAVAPIWGRCLIDYRMADRMRLYDYKTWAGGSDAHDFLKYLVREGRDIQAPHYQSIVAKIEDVSWDAVTFRYVVQSTEPPFTLSVVEFDEQMAAWSRERWQWAMDKFAKCGKAGAWTGRVPRTHYVPPLPYAISEWAAKVDMDAAAERLLAGEG